MPSTSPDTPTRQKSDGDYVTNRSAVIGIRIVLSLAGIALVAAVWLGQPGQQNDSSEVVVKRRETRAVEPRRARHMPQPTASAPFDVQLPDAHVILEPAAPTEPYHAEDVVLTDSTDEPRIPPLELPRTQPPEFVPDVIPPESHQFFRSASNAQQIRQQLDNVVVTLDVQQAIDESKSLGHSIEADVQNDEQRTSGNYTSNEERARRMFLANHPDFRGLRVLQGSECRMSQEKATFVAGVSRRYHRFDVELSLALARRARGYPYSDSGEVPTSEDEIEAWRDANLVKRIKAYQELQRPEAMSAAVQMLQVQRLPVRLLLVDILSSHQGRDASLALANRAVFDLSEDVRQAAREALKERPKEHVRAMLLESLRYPWPPVANRAAKAIVGLEDREAVVGLIELLDAPDPQAPFLSEDHRLVKRELVRVNHLRNCLLCHAKSETRKEPLLAPIPTPGQPLPRVYYSRSRGDLVRADVTYLKQDFSLLCEVSDHGKWPKMQRFDYFVRTREVRPEESNQTPAQQQTTTDESDDSSTRYASYPQREAVVFALQKLTGGVADASSKDWRRLMKTLKKPKANAQAIKTKLTQRESPWKNQPESP
jgi:hypothetical protein